MQPLLFLRRGPGPTESPGYLEIRSFPLPLHGHRQAMGLPLLP